MECDGIVDEDDGSVEGFYDLRRSLIKAPSYPRWCLSIARGYLETFLMPSDCLPAAGLDSWPAPSELQ